MAEQERPHSNGWLDGCLAAVQAFSRIPVRASIVGSTQWESQHAACARHWPAVGLLAGVASALAFVLVSLPLPQGAMTPLVAAVAAAMASAWLTGARQEDSLARQAGQVALMLALAGKLVLLALLGLHAPAAALAALLAAQTVSRFLALLLAWSLPAAQAELREREHPFAQPANRRALAVAAAWCVVPLVLMLLADGFPFTFWALLMAVIAFGLLRRRIARRDRPFTIDAVGAAQQACELAFYLGAAFGVGR